jgi:hypothetical protein
MITSALLISYLLLIWFLFRYHRTQLCHAGLTYSPMSQSKWLPSPLPICPPLTTSTWHLPPTSFILSKVHLHETLVFSTTVLTCSPNYCHKFMQLKIREGFQIRSSLHVQYSPRIFRRDFLLQASAKYSKNLLPVGFESSCSFIASWWIFFFSFCIYSDLYGCTR